MNEPVRKRVVDIGHGIPWLQAPGWINQVSFTILERLLGYHHINRLYREAAEMDPAEHYLSRLVEAFGFMPLIEGLPDCDWPREGPVVVVANHPFGGADSTVVGELAFGMRSDTKILANEFLAAIEPLSDSLIPVDVFGGAEAARKNRRGLRETADHLREGGQLLMFPAGEVASWSWQERAIAEPPWANHVLSLARKFDATVMPIFVRGRNSVLFQVLGMIHPFLRTAWLGREKLRRRGSEIEVVIRSPIPPQEIEGMTAEDLRRICLGEKGNPSG